MVKERVAVWDIVKALGIISIVLGHCVNSSDIVNLVYSFHIMIFFFVSGVFFKDKFNTLKDFGVAIFKKVYSLWKPYTAYYILLLIIGSVFFVKRSLTDFIKQIFNVLLLNGYAESLAGALWFVRALTVACVLFMLILFLSQTVLKNKAYILSAVISLLCGLFGAFFVAIGRSLPYNAVTSLLAIPIMFAGYSVKHFSPKLKNIFKWWSAVPIGFINAFIILKYGIFIELSKENIGNVPLFYIISFMGIYVICTLAFYLSKLKAAEKILSFIGKYSFDIMALHFLVFRLSATVIAAIKGDISSAAVFPVAFREFWPIYTLLGVFLPPILRFSASRIYNAVKNRIKSYCT